jgi:hypothetical protein
MFTIKAANTEILSTNTFGQGVNWTQISLGIFVLITGTLVYIIDRSPEHTYFIYQTSFNLSLYDSLPGIFGSIGDSLPSFVHAFSFILITAGLIATHKNTLLPICLFWFVIDSLFEFGQVLIDSANAIPAWFSRVPFLENTENYFINGTFDWNDMAATAFGVLIAYLVLRATTNTGRSTS